MNPKFLLTILSLVLITFCSCEKDQIIDNGGIEYSCEFVQNDEDMDGAIDETENALIQQCIDDAYSSKEEIENNLIGEWKLIGHGQGWALNVSQPCAHIIVDENSLTFKFEDKFEELLITSEWEIVETTNSNNVSYQLELKNNVNHDAINMTSFSPELMFSNFLAIDGNMYLYEKIVQ